MNTNIGYIICEAAEQAVESTIVGELKNRVIIETVLQDADVKNRNGRFYSKSELFPQLKCERMTELISTGNLKGENGHPKEQSLAVQSTIDPMKVCVRYLKIWTEGNLIKAHACGTQNQLGADFNNDVLSGEKPSFSLRALGTINNTSRGAEVKNIKIVTWDRVYYPSHKKAYMEKIVSESGIVTPNMVREANRNLSKQDLIINSKGIVVPFDTEDVTNYIKQESTNFKSISESFDMIFETSKLLQNSRGKVDKIQLSDGRGHTVIMNLEDHIQNEIMSYCENHY